MKTTRLQHEATGFIVEWYMSSHDTFLAELLYPNGNATGMVFNATNGVPWDRIEIEIEGLK